MIAAAKVLSDAKQSLATKEMIEAMGAKKDWSSPGGKRPAATRYSAILREIQVKGKEARFKKTERRKFGLLSPSTGHAQRPALRREGIFSLVRGVKRRISMA